MKNKCSFSWCKFYVQILSLAEDKTPHNASLKITGMNEIGQKKIFHMLLNTHSNFFNCLQREENPLKYLHTDYLTLLKDF